VPRDWQWLTAVAGTDGAFSSVASRCFFSSTARGRFFFSNADIVAAVSVAGSGSVVRRACGWCEDH
jgi:hypothetical protein